MPQATPAAASVKAAAKRLANLRPFKPGQSGSEVKSRRYLELQANVLADVGVRDLSELSGIDRIAVEQITQQLLRAERCKDNAESARCSRTAREWWRQLQDRRAKEETRPELAGIARGWRMTAASRADRFRTLCRQAAKRLGVKASDDRCAHYATLQLAREAAAAKLIAGRDIDPAVLLRIDESLRAFMPATDPVKVEIDICRRLHEHCRKCGASQPFVCKECGYGETVEADANKPPPLPAVAKPLPAEPPAPMPSGNLISIHSHPTLRATRRSTRCGTLY